MSWTPFSFRFIDCTWYHSQKQDLKIYIFSKTIWLEPGESPQSQRASKQCQKSSHHSITDIFEVISEFRALAVPREDIVVNEDLILLPLNSLEYHWD